MRCHDNVDAQGMSIFNVNYQKLFLSNSSFCGSAKAIVQYVSIHELKYMNTQATENPINYNNQSNSPLAGWRSDMERSTFASGKSESALKQDTDDNIHSDKITCTYIMLSHASLVTGICTSTRGLIATVQNY